MRADRNSLQGILLLQKSHLLLVSDNQGLKRGLLSFYRLLQARLPTAPCA